VTAGDDLGGQGDERTLLVGFLDWYRDVVVNKVGGLSTDAATTVMTASGLSPLGVVAHLSAVEVGWFAETFDGQPVDPSWDDRGAFRLAARDTVESVVDEYRLCCDRSRSIVAATESLDALATKAHVVWGHVSLRWMLLHMVEETARHAGHLDIMREAIDGQTGD
jgi:Protein of unknown function (DUF664)